MDTSREDVGIAIRSAFIAKGTKQKFSLFALVVLSIVLISIETIEAKPFDYFRSFIKDTIYRGSLIASVPSRSFGNVTLPICSNFRIGNPLVQTNFKIVWG